MLKIVNDPFGRLRFASCTMSSLKDLLPAPTDGYIHDDEAPVAPPRTNGETLNKESDLALTTTTPFTVVAAPTPPCAGVSKILSLKTSEDGRPDYSSVVRQGENASRTVHTGYDAMLEKPREDALQTAPSQSDIAESTRCTRAALDSVLAAKVNAPSSVSASEKRAKEKATFVRYTPANAHGAASATASRQRIIKLVEAQRDPMEPPRFSQRKAPVNPPSPPVPVMHSPERKLSKSEAADWKIPPVVSDWKNNRGYTISLDKRLAADGRAHIDRSINDRFANMAEALYQAEKTARDEVERRADLQRQVSLRAKAAREKELRDLAEKARQERKGYLGLSEKTDIDSIAGGRSEAPLSGVAAPSLDEESGVARAVEDEAPPSLPGCGESTGVHSARPPRRSRFANEESVEVGTNAAEAGENDDVRRRDEIRRERRLQREREMKMRGARGDDTERPTLKRSKMTRDIDRDVSEQAALGQAVLRGGGGGEVLYDERLFNQDSGGRADGGRPNVAGGYGPDDMYNLYEEPLFKGGASSARMHRVSRNVHELRGGNVGEEDGENGRVGGGEAVREGPVEFERDVGTGGNNSGDGQEDVYGLNTFLDRARKG